MGGVDNRLLTQAFGIGLPVRRTYPPITRPMLRSLSRRRRLSLFAPEDDDISQKKKDEASRAKLLSSFFLLLSSFSFLRSSYFVLLASFSFSSLLSSFFPLASLYFVLCSLIFLLRSLFLLQSSLFLVLSAFCFFLSQLFRAAIYQWGARSLERFTFCGLVQNQSYLLVCLPTMRARKQYRKTRR